ncbi:MAG: ATP-binding protein, partial [Desulfofustis sp.]|nr:ATP-binding protein [Desulfofustis sp.]
MPKPDRPAPHRRNAISNWPAVMPSKTAKPELIVFIGLTGSGKSYLAERWAAAKGYSCINSD